MSAIVVYSERDEIAWQLLGKGLQLKAALGGPLCIALLGPGAGSRTGEAFNHGAEQAIVSEDPALSSLASDVLADALCQIVTALGPDGAVLVGSTLRGKALAPRLAQKLRAGCVTDAIGLDVTDGHLVAKRYAYGGNTVATEAVVTPYQVVAIMPKTCEPRSGFGSRGKVVALPLTIPAPRLRIVERHAKTSSGGDIEEAEALVCVGRGLRRKEDLHMVEQLASLLGAQIGCTRSLSHDYHWLDEDRLVGLSGKKAKPRLYMGIGLSGQIQHTVGVMGARLIVAINTDKDAPIFQMADYGIVGDLYEVVPKLIDHLQRN